MKNMSLNRSAAVFLTVFLVSGMLLPAVFASSDEQVEGNAVQNTAEELPGDNDEADDGEYAVPGDQTEDLLIDDDEIMSASSEEEAAFGDMQNSADGEAESGQAYPGQQNAESTVSELTTDGRSEPGQNDNSQEQTEPGQQDLQVPFRASRPIFV